MNEQQYPLLEQLHVLRTSVLCSMRDRAFDVLPLYLAGYGDGIVSGCRLETNAETITLLPGLVKHENFLYLIREPMRVFYEPADAYVSLRLFFPGSEESEMFVTRTVELDITPDLEPTRDTLELCRFKLKTGAMLRSRYRDFFDRVTEYDTLNTIYSPFAAQGGSTLSPDITRAFAGAAQACELTPLDQSFVLAALEGQAMTAAQIAFYIRQRLGMAELPVGNEALYEGLACILREISGIRRTKAAPARGRREVLVD